MGWPGWDLAISPKKMHLLSSLRVHSPRPRTHQSMSLRAPGAEPELSSFIPTSLTRRSEGAHKGAPTLPLG